MATEFAEQEYFYKKEQQKCVHFSANEKSWQSSRKFDRIIKKQNRKSTSHVYAKIVATSKTPDLNIATTTGRLGKKKTDLSLFLSVFFSFFPLIVSHIPLCLITTSYVYAVGLHVLYCAPHYTTCHSKSPLIPPGISLGSLYGLHSLLLFPFHIPQGT